VLQNDCDLCGDRLEISLVIVVLFDVKGDDITHLKTIAWVVLGKIKIHVRSVREQT